MRSFEHKVAVITGAGSGIGRALALNLARAGARLALSDIDDTGLAETRALLPVGTEAKRYRLDVTDAKAVFAHADEVKRDFGAAHLLFNNAGTSLVGYVENQSIEEMRWLVEINLWGVIHGVKAFLPLMLAQKEGVIVNLSSVLGLVGFPSHSAYNITKFGVRALTEALWQELEGSGVRAVSVHPGGVLSGMERRARVCANGGERELRQLSNLFATMRTTPERCARDILDGVRRGKRRIVTGHMAGLLASLARLFPESYPVFMRPYTR